MSYGYTGLNLERVITQGIIPIVPKKQVILYLYDAQTNDEAGNVIVEYLTYPTVAQVELADNQTLKHKQYFNYNTITKHFYIQSFTLTGLNRNLQTGGDYVYMVENQLYYRIVELPEDYRTGWVHIIGTETVSLTGS